MPRISAFYGITIWMHYDEGGHAVPHFHARYAARPPRSPSKEGRSPGSCQAAPRASSSSGPRCTATTCCATGRAPAAARPWLPSSPFPKMPSMAALPEVTGVEVLEGHRLRVSLADGTAGVVDLAYLLGRGPVFEPLRDHEYFARVRVDREGGTIVWPNGADVAPETLYAAVRAESGAI